MQHPHLFAPHEGTYWGFAAALFLVGYMVVIWRRKPPPRDGWLWQRHLSLVAATLVLFVWLSVTLLVVQRSEPRAYTAFGEIVGAGVLVVITIAPVVMYLRQKHSGIPTLGYLGALLLNGIAMSLFLQMAGLYAERPGPMQFFNGVVYTNYWFNSMLVVMWPLFKGLIRFCSFPSKLYPKAKPE